MKKGLIAGIAIALASGYAIASPYITTYQLKSAAEDKDGEALSRHIDFPTLRQNFKDQMKAHLARELAKEPDNSVGAMLGASLGNMLVSGMIDAYVTPSGVIAMMGGAEPVPPGTSPASKDPDTSAGNGESDAKPFSNADLSYEAWDRFHVDVLNDDGDVITFVLQRRGISWKLANVLVPMDS